MSAVEKTIAALLSDNDRTDQEFTWSDEVVAVGEQLEIAVYTNRSGNVVIRQRSWPEEDAWIVVRPENVPALCRALCREAGVEILLPSLPAPKSSGAERSRRYRQRHAQQPERDDRDAETVTRDGELDLQNAAE